MISVQARQALLKKQAELEKRLTHQSAEQCTDELIDPLTLITLQELRRVKIALHKIGKPGFGSCINCGQIIGKQRLSASTEINTCIYCAKHHIH